MGVTYKLIFTLASLVQASIALTWTNQAAVRDGTTIPVCAGQNVDLSWAYTVPSSEHVVDIEWHFTADGHSADELLATLVNGHFFADPSATQHMQHLANAGIRLINVTTAQSGVYSVQINIQGQSQTYSQSIHVVVTAAAITTDGSLHAYLDSPILDGGTQEYHLMLRCGTFNTVWDSRVNVVWTTPRGQTLSSTTHENGKFTLAIPNPLVSGQYTCKIDNSSPAKSCIPSNSPLLRGATVHVDGTEGRLMLLESRESHMAEQIHALQIENSALASQVQTLQNEKTSLTAQIKTLQNEDSSFNTRIQRLEQTVNIRLIGGANLHEGRVEIQVGSAAFGTVCDDDWDNLDARVVCRMLGLPSNNARAWSGAHFGQGSGTILLDDVNCAGSESHLLDCSHRTFGTHDCSHGEDAGVTCA